MNPVLRKDIEICIQMNERAIAEAGRVSDWLKWTLHDSKRRSERAERELRRAGLLRD